MVPDLMAFDKSTMHEIRPTFGMRAQYEERRENFVVRQRVENARSCIGIGAVIECQADLLALSWELAEHPPKYSAVTVKCPMRKSAEQRHTNRGSGQNHTVTRDVPSAAAYTSRFAHVTEVHP